MIEGMQRYVPGVPIVVEPGIRSAWVELCKEGAAS